MNGFEKEIIKRNCKHPLVDVIDLKSFDSKCRVCGRIVTKREIVEIIEKEGLKKRRSASKEKPFGIKGNVNKGIKNFFQYVFTDELVDRKL